MSNPVTHFEVLGRNAAALQSFYADAFGWRMNEQVQGYAMALPDSDRGIKGGVGPAPNGGAGHVTFYVEVDDVDAALRRIESLGGRTVVPATAVPNGPTFALFSDPEGHLVGLAKPPRAA